MTPIPKLGDQSPSQVDITGGRIIRLRELQAFKAKFGDVETPLVRTQKILADSMLEIFGGDTLRATLGETGNLGVGVAPFPNGLDGAVGVDIGPGAGLFGYANNAYLSSNLYYKEGWRRKEAGAGGVLVLAGGTLQFYTSPSDVSDSQATVTLAFLVDSTGKMTISGALLSKGGPTGHHVEAYGAVGGGITDDTAAIQAAIAAAIAGTNGSNMVVFGSKTYRITDTLSIDLSSGKTIRIVGEAGYASLTDSLTNASGTVIDCDFASTGKIGIHIFTSGTTTGAAAALCHFHLLNFALKFTGSATDSYGLVIGNTGYQVNGSNNSRIENINVAGFHGDQVLMISTRYVYCHNVVATSRSSGTTTQALRVTNDDSTRFTGDLTFSNCTFIGTGEASQDTVKLVATGTGAELRGVRFICSIGYYGRYCLLLSAESGGKLGDIFVQTCQFDGAAASDSDTKTAILISASGAGSLVSGVSVNNSYAVQWQDYGVWVTSSSSGETANIAISNNYIGLCETYGILVDTALGVSVTGNNLFDCCTGGTDGAITFGSAAGGLFTCTGNTHWNASATRTAGYVVTVAEASAGTITEFIVTNNVGHADVGAVFDNTTTANKTVSGNWRRA